MAIIHDHNNAVLCSRHFVERGKRLEASAVNNDARMSSYTLVKGSKARINVDKMKQDVFLIGGSCCFVGKYTTLSLHLMYYYYL